MVRRAIPYETLGCGDFHRSPFGGAQRLGTAGAAAECSIFRLARRMLGPRASAIEAPL